MQSAIPQPSKIIVHYADGDYIELTTSHYMFEPFWEKSQDVILSLDTLLPLLTPDDVLDDFKKNSTYVELIFSDYFDLVTGRTIPVDERYKATDENLGRVVVQTNDIIFFLSGSRSDVVLIREKDTEFPSAWQGKSLNEIRELVERLKDRE